MKIISVITGDIINSSEFPTNKWFDKLKEVLLECAPETDWEIYRGDSFQLLSDANKALEILFLIKSKIKTIKGLDVRMAIGLGQIEYKSDKLLESNGTAFINSGRSFENLKKDTLQIKSSNDEFNEIFSVFLKMADFICKNWQPKTAEIVYLSLKEPELNQSQLAKKLHKKSQGNISEALKRGGFEEIKSLIDLYKIKIRDL